MSDNVPITAGTGTDIATDDVGSVHYQKVKIALGADGAIDTLVDSGQQTMSASVPVTLASDHSDVKVTLDGEAVVLGAGAAAIGKLAANSGVDIGDVDVTSLPAIPAGNNNIGDVDIASIAAGDNNIGNVDVVTLPALAAGTNVIGQVYGSFVTCSTDVTRQAADTTQYAVNDAMSDSTSAPTSGGFTFTSAARVSGGSGIITDAIVTTANDAATPLQGEIWIFNTSVTNINDNVAFAVSDSEIKTCVAKIPFTLEDAGNNGFYHAQNLSIGYTCSGSANLRFLIRVKNTYTPVGSEVLTFIIKCVRVD